MTLPENKKLTVKQTVFIEQYLICWNKKEAARRAGYKDPQQQGYLLFREPLINEAIQKRLSDMHMSADEALGILAKHARGDMGEFLDDEGNLDLSTAREKGLLPLIKRVKKKNTSYSKKNGDDTEIEIQEIELHDPQNAIEKILRAHGKIKPDGFELVIRYADSNDKSSKTP